MHALLKNGDYFTGLKKQDPTIRYLQKMHIKYKVQT